MFQIDAAKRWSRARWDPSDQFRVERGAACERVCFSLHGQNARDLCRDDRRNSAAVDERTGRDWWLAYGGIFDAAVLYSAAQTPRHRERPYRWSQRRDSTVGWPVVARGDRFGKTRTTHDLGGLRCPASRWRNPKDRDHRREPRARHRLPKIC